MLEEYKRKRDFKITSEPSGEKRSTRKGAKTTSAKKKTGKKQALTFVIQKHDASRLHYDFRLEIDGVMVSWAVPKGPSLNSADRRFAAMTEDHPMEYSDFEGVIPEHQYGAGEVIIWDRGTYSPDEDGVYSWDDKDEANARMRKGLSKGKLTFYLKGEKLEGSWTLVRFGGSKKGKEKDWLLIKHHDEFEDTERDITEEDASVVSGQTIVDLQENGAKKIWTRSGAKKANPKTTGKSSKAPAKKTKGRKSAKKHVVLDENKLSEEEQEALREHRTEKIRQGREAANSTKSKRRAS
ncbi:MAG TPA: hypothetical protein EYN91_03360 [Candidatus Melainabacteria bacterium]|jgi:bifunctional non-homologous end joining protein LigD|nr:hypothetical protein [Candidatus Melainabacteria bacterium]HIN67006.1 hypothetical protein [Candidatus Obscuribacterales bacterium]